MTQLSPRTRRMQWMMVALLVCAGCVNYLDRSTLSIANHDISHELHLSPTRMGMLLSAFAWVYALCQLPAGAITDRLGSRIMLAGGMLLWSIAQIVSGTVHSFAQFLLARGALGFGESPMFTAGARASVNWFPIEKRGWPLGLFNASSSLGPAIAPPLLTALMLAFGWRPMFMLMGALGLIVAIAWWLVYRDPEDNQATQSDLDTIRAGDMPGAGPSGPRLWAKLAGIPTTWAMVMGLFGIVYLTWLYVSWLPDYLETVRHVSVAQTGLLAAIPQAAGFVGAMLGGVLSDGLAKLKVDPVLSRKIPLSAGLMAAAVFSVLGPLMPNTAWALVMMSAALFCAYSASSCSWALGATIAPPDAVATIESVQNIGGSIGGALAPLVTGAVVQATGGFNLAFYVAAAAAAVSALSYALVSPNAYRGLGREH